MNASKSIEQDGDLLTFLPGIHGEEYALRSKMKSLRNSAQAMIRRTTSDTARHLAWEVVERVTVWIYEPASLIELGDLNRLFTRLMLTAIQAENIDEYGPGIIPTGNSTS